METCCGWHVGDEGPAVAAVAVGTSWGCSSFQGAASTEGPGRVWSLLPDANEWPKSRSSPVASPCTASPPSSTRTDVQRSYSTTANRRRRRRCCRVRPQRRTRRWRLSCPRTTSLNCAKGVCTYECFCRHLQMDHPAHAPPTWRLSALRLRAPRPSSGQRPSPTSNRRQRPSPVPTLPCPRDCPAHVLCVQPLPQPTAAATRPRHHRHPPASRISGRSSVVASYLDPRTITGDAHPARQRRG